MEQSLDLQGTRTESIWTNEGKKLVLLEVSTDQIKQTAGCALVINEETLTDGKPNSEWQLDCMNPKYSFTLKKSSKSKDWRITEAIKGGGADGFSTIEFVKRAFRVPVVLNYNDIDDWPAILASKDFELISIAGEVISGTNVVTIDFKMHWLPTKGNVVRISGGQVSFDPKHLWVMKTSNVSYAQYRGDGKVPTYVKEAGYFEYAYSAGEFPLLKRFQSDGLDESGGVINRGTIEYNLTLNPSDDSPAIFTLSAFDLPEPEWLFGNERRSTYIWIGIAGIAFVILAAFLKWRTRRHNG